MSKTLIVALAATAALLMATPAPAQSGPMDDAALGGHRGGLQTSSGLDIGFGASVQTYVDGSLALQTELVWAPEGVQTTRVFQAEGAQALGGLSGPVSLGDGIRVIHDLSASRIASVVINTANDRTIRQDTNITLALPQLPQLQAQFAAARLAAGLEAAAAPFGR